MTVKVLLITSEGCKPCSRVKRVLRELQAGMPDLDVELVELSSPLGTRLAAENMILYPPAVFIGGKLFAKGKVNTDEMSRTIREANGSGE